MYLKAILKNRLVQICLGIVAAVVLFFLLLPVAAKYYLADWLERNGADRATIETLRFNPFRSRITLKGMAVEAEGRSVFRDLRGVVDFNLLALFQRDIHLQEAEYRNLAIDLEQYRDGRWRIGSYTMAGDTGAAAEPPREGAAWIFTADRLTLTDCLVRLKTPGLATSLTIDRAELTRFTTRENGQAASLALQGSLDGGPVAVQLERIQLTPEVRLVGTVSLSGLRLAGLAGLVGAIFPDFAGEVKARGRVSYGGSPGKAMLAEYDGTLSVAGPDIGNGDFAAKAETLTWQGRMSYESQAKGPATIMADGELAAAGFFLRLPGQQLEGRESGIGLRGRTHIVVGEEILVEHEGSLRVKGAEIAGPDLEAAGALLDWQGRVAYDEEKSKVPTVDLEGVLAGEGLRLVLAGLRWQFQPERVEVRTKSVVRLGERPEPSGRSTLAVDHFLLRRDDQPALAFDRLDVSGLTEAGDNLAFEELAVTAVQASLPGAMPLAIDLPELRLTGWTVTDLKDFRGNELQCARPAIRSEHNGEELIRLAGISAREINGAEDIRVGRIEADDLVLLAVAPGSPGQPVLTAGRARLETVTWREAAGLHGEALQLEDLTANIIREKDGALAVRNRFAAMRRPAPEEAPQPSSDGGTFRLGKVTVGGRSGIAFTDHTLAEPFTTHLAITRLDIGALDPSRPEEKTGVLLEGELEQRAPVHVAGTVSPFLAKPAAELQLSLKNYPLTSLSPYTARSVGTALASGQLRLESRIQLADDTLDMKNDILLQKLETETVAPELAGELNNRLPVPLDSALALLRDNNRDISLDLPIHGPLNDLNVGLDDVLVTALGKAIVPAVSGYLMYALGPYGALAYVGLKVGEKMLQVSLPPVVFLPQAASINTEQAKYLERVAKILKDRPETDFQLCPVVPAWELLSEEQRAAGGDTVEIEDQDRERLVELGQRRAAAIRDHLVATAGVKKERLLICTTRVEKEKKAQPSVLLQM